MRSRAFKEADSTGATGTAGNCGEAAPDDMAHASPKSVKVRRSRFWGLRWQAPHRFFAHGLAGLVFLVCGLALTVCSIAGEFSLLRGWALNVYASAGWMNAIGALFMLESAPKHVRPIFRSASYMQLCLVWQAWRYRPAAAHAAALPWVMNGLTRAIDGGVAVGMLSINAYFVISALTTIRREQGTAVCVGLLVGCFGLLLMTGYPALLAIGGDEWVDCLCQQYPMQREGFSGYIYVPTSWVFGVVLFGATLLNRKIISATEFGVVCGGMAGSCLVVTVMMQEVWIPFVSTQRLILPCPEALPGSALAGVVEALDTSKLAQTILRQMGMVALGADVTSAGDVAVTWQGAT